MRNLICGTPIINEYQSSLGCVFSCWPACVSWVPVNIADRGVNLNLIFWFIWNFRDVTTTILPNRKSNLKHYNDVIMSSMASQITSLAIVYSVVNSDANQRKHQSSASLAFVRGIHRWPMNSPHKWPVTRKMFPFDDVIMRNVKVVRSDHGATSTDEILLQDFLRFRVYGLGICKLYSIYMNLNVYMFFSPLHNIYVFILVSEPQISCELIVAVFNHLWNESHI